MYGITFSEDGIAAIEAFPFGCRTFTLGTPPSWHWCSHYWYEHKVNWTSWEQV